MRSHLLVGKVRHRRARPFTYELEHDVWYAALDLAELDLVARRVRLFRRNALGFASFRDADHMLAPSGDVRTDLLAHLRAEGEDPEGWQVTLIANLRVLGYVFDPASFFLCRDRMGTLRVVVVEVHNTFGGRHLYTLRPRLEDATGSDRAVPFTAEMDKDFFVSPFIGPDGRYAVHVRDEADGLRIGINLRQGAEPTLSASLVLRRRPLTDRSLLRLLVRHPAMSHKTMGMILWHALRLRLKGAPVFGHRAWQRTREGVA